MPSEKILVVDDSRVMREFIADYVLAANGYTPLSAENGQAGLEAARTHAPDLMIADMKMPGLSGIELAETLRAEKRNIPVILITAEGSEEVARQAMRAGVADYLVKPFESDELLQVMRRALELRRVRQEHEQAQAELAASNETLRRRLQELETLISVGRNVTAVLDLDQVLQNVVEAAVSLTSAEEGSLLLLDEHTSELTM